MARSTTAIALTATLFAFACSNPLGSKRSADDECTGEIAKLCPAMQPGDGKYGKCLIANEAQLSAPCKPYAQAAAARQRTLKQFPSCVADAEKFCPHEKPVVTEVMACLRGHQGDLSESCKYEIGRDTGRYEP